MVKWMWYLFLIFNMAITESLQARITNNCSVPSILNGKVRFRGRTRKFAKFICDRGFDISGNRFATCISGEWDNPTPICVRQGCTTPTHLENGIVLVMRNEAEVMFFCTPGHKLVGSSTIYCDGVHWNDTVPTCIELNTPPKLSCDFESPDLCGWIDDELHDFDWRRLNKKTPSSFLNTGPSTDHTPSSNGSGYYMYIESTSRRMNETARLISPVYSGSLAKNGCFSFYYHMFGEYIGGLRVYQKPELLPLYSMLALTGENLKKYLLFEKWGNQGDFWYGSVKNLSDFSDNFQIIIEGIRGMSFTSDIAIDDVDILQGEDACHAAEALIPTPDPNILYNSCTGRCVLISKNEYIPPGGCSCSATCSNSSNCCSDFYDVCLFGPYDISSPSDDDVNSDDRAPRTEKLVATKVTHAEVTETSASIQTTEQTNSTKITTHTTSKKFHIVLNTTPKAPINGGSVNVSQNVTTKSTTTVAPKTTSTAKTTLTARTTSTTKTISTAKTTQSTVLPTTRTTPNIDTTTIKPKRVVQKKLEPKKEERENDEGSSSMKTLAIILGVLLSVSACIYIVHILRGGKGIATIALISRTARNDPEVTFLTRNEALEED